MDEQRTVPSEASSGKTIFVIVAAVVGFFAFLAEAVPFVNAKGWGTNALFFVIIGAIAVACIIPIIGNWILGKLHLKGKSRRQLLHMAVGYEAPDSVPMLWDEMTNIVPAEPYEGVQEDWALVPMESAYVDEVDEEPAEELIETDGLRLTENFQPAPSSLTTQNVVFVGIRRMGKSNAFCILIQRLAERGFPLVIFDTEDEYEELARKKYMPRGVLVGSEDSRADVPEGIRTYTINQESAYNFGQFVLEHNLQAVINLKAWNDANAAGIMSEIILGLEDWQQSRPIPKRIPFYIAIDEITKWVPQNQGESTLSREATKAIQNALFDVVVRRGGKRGFGLLIAGQKYAEIDKRILQGVWRVIFCQSEKNDLAYCEKQHGIDPEEVRSLQKGESFVFCPQVPQGMFVQWPLSNVPLGGKSPGMDNLAEHHRQLQTRSVTGALSQMEYAQRLKTYQSAAATQEEKRTAPLDAREDAEEAEIPTVEEAATAWKDGHSSVRLLMDHFHITYYQANKLYREAVAKHLIIPQKVGVR